MTRVKKIEIEEAPPELAEAYQDSLNKFGQVPNFFQVLGHVPATVAAWQSIETATRLRNLKDNAKLLRFQQMAIIRTSSVNGSGGRYCLAHNVALATDIGFTADDIAAIRGDYLSSELLTDEEKAVIRWAEAVTRLEAEGDEAAFSSIKEFLTDSEIVELTSTICMWNYSNRMCGALHIEPEPPGVSITFFPSQGK